MFLLVPGLGEIAVEKRIGVFYCWLFLFEVGFPEGELILVAFGVAHQYVLIVA